VLITLAIKRTVARTLEKIGRAVPAMVGIGAEAWLGVRAILVVAIVQLGIDAE
jgi:hypothetical protein